MELLSDITQKPYFWPVLVTAFVLLLYLVYYYKFRAPHFYI